MVLSEGFKPSSGRLKGEYNNRYTTIANLLLVYLLNLVHGRRFELPSVSLRAKYNDRYTNHAFVKWGGRWKSNPQDNTFTGYGDFPIVTTATIVARLCSLANKS